MGGSARGRRVCRAQRRVGFAQIAARWRLRVAGGSHGRMGRLWGAPCVSESEITAAWRRREVGDIRQGRRLTIN